MARIWSTGRSRPATPLPRVPTGPRKPRKKRNRTAAEIRAKKKARSAVRTKNAVAGTTLGKAAGATVRGASGNACAEPTEQPDDEARSEACPMVNVTQTRDTSDDAVSSHSGERTVTVIANQSAQAVVPPQSLASSTVQPVRGLFYRIYGQNYGSRRVTVTASYATTKQTWHVTRVIDSRSTERGYEYRVLWLNRKRRSHRYYQRTWEPKQQLLEDHFEQELDFVDRWKLSNVPSFDEFFKTDSFGAHTIGADMAGHCLFNAFKLAADLTGRSDIVSSSDINTFVAAELLYYHKDLTQGTSWKVFKVFLRELRDAGRDFLYWPLVKRNLAIAGRRGARVLEEVELFDGLYLCAAYNHSFVGHAFVLCVQGDKRLVFDQDEGKPVQSADWINFVAFVRPIIFL